MGDLILGERCAWGAIPFASAEATLSLMAEQIAELFAAPFAPDAAGLYVASSNAGFGPSVEFWFEARRQGLAVASPALFPWTLANAPCGWIARTFQVKGPSFTYTGGASALRAAVTQAWDDLNLGRTTTSWIVALDFARSEHECSSFAVARLSRDGSLARRLVREMETCSDSIQAATALTGVLRRLAPHATGTGQGSD